MGWTGMELKSGLSKMDRAVKLEGLDRARVVASSEKGNALYVAYRGTEGRVFGLVVIFERCGAQTLAKSMDEGMGPFYTEASAQVLDALTEPTSQYAIEWRSACREKLANPAPRIKLHDAVAAKTDLIFGAYGVVGAGTKGDVVKLGVKRVTVLFPGIGLRSVTKTSLSLIPA